VSALDEIHTKYDLSRVVHLKNFLHTDAGAVGLMTLLGVND
jgi:hypothetical protein